MPLISKRGDTILEVTIAITIFCIVSIISMGIMDRDLNTIQGTLELEMARNEIDAQAEALRFIHNSFLSEREYTTREYDSLWKRLAHGTTDFESGLANNPADISPFSATQCSTYYDKSATNSGEPHNIFADHAFIINTRNLDPSNVDQTLISASTNEKIFKNTTLYPRIIYTASSLSGSDTDSSLTEAEALTKTTYNNLSSAEGIWIIAARDATDSKDAKLSTDTPEFFDFHIRTCWYPPNRTYPNTIATIVRLYNPEVIKEAQ